MIGHEAIAPDLCLRLEGCFAEQVNVQRVVLLLKEDLTSPVSTLGNMVGVAGDNYPG